MRYLVYKLFPSEGAYIGCDLTGEVVKLGSNLKVGLKVGDRVGASVAGGKYSRCPVYPTGKFADFQNLYSLDAVSGRGAFSEYVKTFSDLVWKIPEGTFSFEQAVAVGTPWVSRFPSDHPPTQGL